MDKCIVCGRFMTDRCIVCGRHKGPGELSEFDFRDENGAKSKVLIHNRHRATTLFKAGLDIKFMPKEENELDVS